MNQFPRIEGLADVLPAIKGRDEFVVRPGPQCISVDYNFVLPDSFDCPIRRECRGIKFHPLTGKTIGRPFQKFFNMGEKPGTGHIYVSTVGIQSVMDKLDGSMVHAFRGEFGQWLLATRAGVTDHAIRASELLDAYDEMYAMLDHIESLGATPIFEWTAPDNRIVVRYDEPALTLLAMRGIVEGEYWDQGDVEDIADAFGVPFVESMPYPLSSRFDPLAVAHETGREGYVLRLCNGEMLKIKTDEYVLMHRSKDEMRNEKDLLRIVLEDKVDDFLPVLDEDDAYRVRVYDAAVKQMVARLAEGIAGAVDYFQVPGATRKDYAAFVTELDPVLRGPAFKAFDGEDPTTEVRAALMRLTSNGTKTREAMDRLMRNTAADRGFAST
jgi:RNA ligase